MAIRFNPPSNWPTPPAGWHPQPGWAPDPAWGPVPPGWRLWVDDGMDESSGSRVTAAHEWARRHKVLTGIGAFVVFAVIVSSLGGPGDEGTPVAGEGSSPTASTSSSAPTSKAMARARPTATEPAVPVVTTKRVIEIEPVPFGTLIREDATRPAGTTAVTTVGVAGVRTLTYSVTYTDGVETARVLIGDVVTTAPVDEVTTVGTYVEPPPPPGDDGGCDPNYAGACVPIDSDVDCAGGSGDGPSYVQGPVRVIGVDIYDLDRDGDGIGCDS